MLRLIVNAKVGFFFIGAGLSLQMVDAVFIACTSCESSIDVLIAHRLSIINLIIISKCHL